VRFLGKRAVAIFVSTAVIVGGVVTGLESDFFKSALVEVAGTPEPDLGLAVRFTAHVRGPGEMPGNMFALRAPFVATPEDLQVMSHRSDSGDSADRYVALLNRLGPVRLDDTFIDLSLQGNRAQQVRVRNIRVVNLRRSPPLTGTLWCDPSAGGGPAERMYFDLDQAIPIAQLEGSDDGTIKPYFLDRTITLNQGENIDLNIRASSSKSDITFDLAVDVVYGGNLQTVTVTDNGRPFEVTGYPNSESRTLLAALPHYQTAYSLPIGQPATPVDPRTYQRLDGSVCG
jgi:hypothetical protein